jgi:hypoxanthine phosphoribosyltransferase
MASQGLCGMPARTEERIKEQSVAFDNTMSELEPVFNEAAIAREVAEVARRISADFKGRDLVVVGVLKGAFIFMADLVRQISLDTFTIDFIRAASYGSETESSGSVRILKDIETDIEGRDVLIVEDILDTGHTLSCLIDVLRARRPGSIKVCTLIDKQERREADLTPDYACFKVEQGFLVGFGLDFDEAYRNLPGIFHLTM